MILYSNPYPKIKKKFSFYFKLSGYKFARDLQNTQTQNPNTQKIEGPNPNLNLLVLFSVYTTIFF